MKVLIVGGGPAGMMAAISASKENNEVIIIEKMESLGRKLLITGKGLKDFKFCFKLLKFNLVGTFNIWDHLVEIFLINDLSFFKSNFLFIWFFNCIFCLL